MYDVKYKSPKISFFYTFVIILFILVDNSLIVDTNNNICTRIHAVSKHFLKSTLIMKDIVKEGFSYHSYMYILYIIYEQFGNVLYISVNH